MAGGSLLTKLEKGFREFTEAGLVSGAAPRLYGAQAAGCAPIVHLVERGGEHVSPVVPEHHRALDRHRQSRRRPVRRRARSAGPAAGRPGVSDAALVDGIRLLAETTGVFTETAGGVTVAAALALAQAGRFAPEDEVVLCITGNGLKTVEALQGALPDAPIIAPRIRELEALYGRDL